MVSKLVCMMLWVVFLLGGWCWCPGDACLDIEKTALLQLKPFFNSYKYSYVDGVNNWGKKGSNCCEWEKVECNSSTGRVIRFYLNLTATIKTAKGYFDTYPDFWEDRTAKQWYLNVSLFHPFEELQSLYLSGNSLAGFLDNQGFEKKLEKLEILDLSDNYFSDRILASLSELPSLKYLYLRKNRFDGSNPNDGIKRLSKLKNLETLDLHDNYMFGNSIVSNLRNFTSLTSLSLQGCGLHGTLEMQEFNNLVNLKELYLSYNEIESLGSSFQGDELRLKKLEVLVLSYNLFNNTIFSSLTSLPNLKSLYISDNNLEGPIRIKDINDLSSLVELDISYNQVNDFLPSQGNERLRNLKALDLSDNLFNNSVLTSLGNLSNLKSLSLGGLEGSIDLTDDRSHNFPNLEEIRLYDSFLQTNFLGSIGQFTSLKRLTIYDCKINGSLTLQGICELGNLKELDLSYNDLEGSLPECFSNLRFLEILHLSNNRLSGNISVLGNLTSLQTLDLSSNHFYGDINALKSLPSLQVLSLSYNNFHIPISLAPLFNLSKLQSLNADNNIISAETQMHPSGAPAFQLKDIRLSCCGDVVGSFPEFLYHQHDLVYLDLSNLYFKGNQFPYWLLENNTRLESMILTNSSLSGSLQLPLANSQMGLRYFDISNNFFNGSIPLEIGEELPSLQFLKMSNNLFTGSIPSSFGDMTSLETLDLSNNQLSGGVPEHLTMSSPSLRVLALSNNKLDGQVFSGNFNLTNLLELRLDGNNFSGWIQDVLANSPSLSTLNVSNNQLSGGIPRWMGNMSSLQKIIMSDNNLQGTIPVEFCQLLDLVLLDLSVNNISGTLPSCFSPSQQITQVNLSKNRLQGTLPNALRNCSTIVTLDLSDNLFTGTIPSWIGGLSNLRYLLLTKNNFHGEIPMELCSLSQLSLINLSHNNLSGSIPPCLNITTLEDASATEYYPDGSLIGPANFSLNEPIDFLVKNVFNSYKGKILGLVSGIDLSCNKLVTP